MCDVLCIMYYVCTIYTNFSKVSSTGIIHGKPSNERTFENIFSAHNLLGRIRIRFLRSQPYSVQTQLKWVVSGGNFWEFWCRAQLVEQRLNAISQKRDLQSTYTVWVCVWLCVCVCVCPRTRIHTHKHRHNHPPTHKHTHPHSHWVASQLLRNFTRQSCVYPNFSKVCSICIVYSELGSGLPFEKC